MERIAFAVIFGLLLLPTLCPVATRAQRKPAPRPAAKPVSPAPAPAAPLKCTPPAVAKNEPMTYRVGSSNATSAEDMARIKESWGTLAIPQGETERAKEIHQRAEAWRQARKNGFDQIYTQWLAISPRATAKQKRAWRTMLDNALRNEETPPSQQGRLALKQFDWRKHLPLWPVLNQGKACNTCWAFATSMAAAASMWKNYVAESNSMHHYFDPNRPGIWSAVIGATMAYTTAGPFVQDLINCMPVNKETLCEEGGWHGTAFNFMVYEKGIPLADFAVEEKAGNKRAALARSRSYEPYAKYACKPTGAFIKGNAWDYVNAPPDKLPTVQQLKAALIAHGPIVAPIYYDECLGAYRGGVFNEKDAGKVNHVVLLIGWDDKKQAWLVQNSWGTEWGEQGYGWIKYGSNNIGMFAAWIEAPARSQPRLENFGLPPQ